MKPFILFILLMVTLRLSAREVALESVICNPGSNICVPVTLDNAHGIAVASFTVMYDATMMTFVKAEDLNESNCQIIFTEYDD
jgi:hypothetical protein